ncbi:hypothetical protein M407DRAFT_26148 [Tulasnella calospora MUT 4182]|uniref:NADP-dependent oxidoreductase domain-containing protein n=1 Tax=Tulasnella calospora MUT 4182 TaxID=1051891 RepID=A0A0C3QES6_9AGAM|nr:hypothetical protein M407DRAFT_26148 [Tulasnella calospora MUT 4182]
MASVPTLKLANGKEIPQIGLGTWQSQPGEVEKAVSYALKDAGYRHIDCAFAYGNEKEVGDGIKQSGVPREEIFITSKIWGTWHNRVEEQLKITLERLGTDYLDLLLVHWPIAMNPEGNHPFFPMLPTGKRDILYDWELRKTWEQFEAVYEKGLVKAIGVSNCSQLKLEEEILPFAKIKPMVNQLEIHPYNPQHNLVKWLKSQDIVVEAFSPLGSTDAPLLKDDVITEIANKLGVSPAEVLIGWGVGNGIVVLPKSVNPDRISSNFRFAKLDSSDMEKINGLAAAGKQKRLIKPPWSMVKLGFEDWFQVDP